MRNSPNHSHTNPEDKPKKQRHVHNFEVTINQEDTGTSGVRVVCVDCKRTMVEYNPELHYKHYKLKEGLL